MDLGAVLAAEQAGLATVVVPCRACGDLAQHHSNTVLLRCLACHAAFSHAPWRTERELVAFIRARLAQDQDASRRAFYNHTSVLFDIAEAVDACPESRSR